jgi:regulator of protease activity HflC (stomatin/prohibitin superfamily)
MFNKLMEVLICGVSKLPHFRTIAPDEQVVLLRFGRYLKTLGKGGHYLFHWPLIHTVMTITTTRQLIDIDKQDILTSDRQSITLNASIEYEIDDPRKALLAVHDFDANIQESAGNYFREAVMSRTLNECVLDIDDIIIEVFEKLRDEAIRQYGITILQVLIPTFTKANTIRLIQE